MVIIMFEGKTLLVGVSGGIAAYKMATLVSELVKRGGDVHVLMTKNATNFISPLTFETLSGNRVLVDTFDRNFQWNVQHVALAKRADLFLLAPATANIVAKICAGIADDMLTTTFLACRCPKIVAPSMNTAMYENPATQRNLNTLGELGIEVLNPAEGYLACGDNGRGRMPEPQELIEAMASALTPKDMMGLSVVVTAGPTCEDIDPVRYLTNRSSGKMGYETALGAARRGANVTLISGQTSLRCPYGVTRVDVRSAEDMYGAVMQYSAEADMVIKSAAVADYTPAQTTPHKLKKGQGGLSLELERTADILATLGKNRPAKQVLVGFCMETQELIQHATQKLRDKGVQLIVANEVGKADAGFAVDTNIVTLLTENETESLPCMSKYALGNVILDRALAIYRTENG